MNNKWTDRLFNVKYTVLYALSGDDIAALLISYLKMRSNQNTIVIVNYHKYINFTIMKKINY